MSKFYRFWVFIFGGNVKEDDAFSGNDVRHSVAIIGNLKQMATSITEGSLANQSIPVYSNFLSFIKMQSYRSESSPGGDQVWVFARIYFVSLLMWGLTGGEPPWLAQHLLQERRLDSQVLRDHVQAKEMSVYTFTAHRVFVAICVCICGDF